MKEIVLRRSDKVSVIVEVREVPSLGLSLIGHNVLSRGQSSEVPRGKSAVERQLNAPREAYKADFVMFLHVCA